MTIGERVAQLLKAQGKMAKDLAEFLGVSASAVTGWSHGSYPSSQYIIKISEFLDVSVEYILTGKDAQPKEADIISGISDDALRVARLWDDLDERGKTIVMAKLYERQEMASTHTDQPVLAERPMLKEA